MSQCLGRIKREWDRVVEARRRVPPFPAWPQGSLAVGRDIYRVEIVDSGTISNVRGKELIEAHVNINLIYR